MIGNKVGAERDPSGGWVVDSRPETVRTQVEDALLALRADFSPLTYLRLPGDSQPPGSTPPEAWTPRYSRPRMRKPRCWFYGDLADRFQGGGCQRIEPVICDGFGGRQLIRGLSARW